MEVPINLLPLCPGEIVFNFSYIFCSSGYELIQILFVWEGIYFSSCLKDNSNIDENSRLVVFFFQHYNVLLYSFLICIVSDEKSAVVLILVLLWVRIFIPLWLLSRFYLCYWLWSLIMPGITFKKRFCFVLFELPGSVVLHFWLILKKFHLLLLHVSFATLSFSSVSGIPIIHILPLLETFLQFSYVLYGCFILLFLWISA